MENVLRELGDVMAKDKSDTNEKKEYRIWDPRTIRLRLKIQQMDHCSRHDLFSFAFAYDAQCDFTFAYFVFRELPTQHLSIGKCCTEEIQCFLLLSVPTTNDMITVLWLLSLVWLRHPQLSALIVRLMLVSTSDDYRKGMGKDDGN